MVEVSATEHGRNFDNPYASPRVNVGDPWSVGPPEALALRQAHRVEEAYAKALAIANVIYFSLFAPWTAYIVWIMISHVAGRVSAPWVTRPGWIIEIFLSFFISVAALAAVFGFLRRKRWALGLEFALAVCWAAYTVLQPMVVAKTPPVLEFIGVCAIYAAISLPMLKIFDLWESIIFDREYSDAIAATKRIAIFPKLPLLLTLFAFALFVSGFALLIIYHPR